MSRLRKHVAPLALVVTLFVSGAALGAPMGESQGLDLRSRVKVFVIRILEDIRATFPGG